MTECYLAIDVGGTKTEVGVVDAHARVIARTRVLTADLRSGGDPLSELIRLGRDVLREAAAASPSGVGVALPGPTDAGRFRMLAAPTIPELEDRPLREPLEAAFGCPAAGENDANACALAEARFGAGIGAASLVYVTISTG